MSGDLGPRTTTDPIAILDGSGESCATLTPVVAARMRGLGSGALLER